MIVFIYETFYSMVNRKKWRNKILIEGLNIK